MCHVFLCFPLDQSLSRERLTRKFKCSILLARLFFLASRSGTHNCFRYSLRSRAFQFYRFFQIQKIGANAPLSWVATHQTHFNWLIGLLIIFIFFANRKKTRTEKKALKKKHVRRAQEMSWDWTLNFMLFGRCSRSHVGNFAFVLVLFAFVRVLVESRCFFFKGCSNCALMKDDAMSEELDDVSFYHDNDLLSSSNVYSWFVIVRRLSGNVMDVDVEGTWKAKNVSLQNFTFDQTRRRLSSCSASWMSMRRWTHFFSSLSDCMSLGSASKRRSERNGEINGRQTRFWFIGNWLFPQYYADVASVRGVECARWRWKNRLRSEKQKTTFPSSLHARWCKEWKFVVDDVVVGAPRPVCVWLAFQFPADDDALLWARKIPRNVMQFITFPSFYRCSSHQFWLVLLWQLAFPSSSSTFTESCQVC